MSGEVLPSTFDDVPVDALPDSVQIDAWAGAPAISKLAVNAERWGARPGLPTQEPLDFGAPPDPTDWANEDVGYGILVPDSADDDWSKEKATGSALPEPIQRLLKARPGTALLYWKPIHKTAFVRRYYDDGLSPDTSDRRIGLTEFGTARDRLPKFVLIAASPEKIPWEVQYSLSLRHAVGRLPFDGDEADAYVTAMLDGDGWASSPPASSSVAVWAVDHGGSDITKLMRAAITTPFIKKCQGRISSLSIAEDADATEAGLVSALAGRPTLLVTSSHGATPLDERELVRDLGLPVAQNFTPVQIDTLMEALPGGSIWFAQACCSAGSSNGSNFSVLLEENTSARLIVDAVAALESSVAPAPLALLQRQPPVRAVFGHVEPTFDWTLRDPVTKARFGHGIVNALAGELHSGKPLGVVLEDYYDGVGTLINEWAIESDRFGETHDRSILISMTRLRLTAWDRQSLVLLGDPTVTIPAIV
jgi:hypothetical protein